MGKNATFSGQPIFSQLLKLINRSDIVKHTKAHQSDRYYKKFKTYDHLVTMLYAIFHKCSSLREVVTGMQVCAQKLNHLGIKYSPRRSTISEANSKRTSEVFEDIYKSLYKHFGASLPDSRIAKKISSRLFIIDSTTIKLFKEILKNAGRKPSSGKRKGGIKVHTMINAEEDVPCLIRMTAAAKHDTPFIQGLKLPKNSIVTFDKAYMDYTQYQLWDKEKITWVTRIRTNAVYELVSENQITAHHKKKGIVSDQNIILGHTSHDNVTRVPARLITYYDSEKKRTFDFITNSTTLAAYTIAQIYKRRWQIEILFKRLKQNYPLQYFLGDNENAIKIQIWCALIADLLIKVVQSNLKKKWSFSNLSSMIRIHLMTYVNLLEFLKNPEKSLLSLEPTMNKGPTLF